MGNFSTTLVKDKLALLPAIRKVIRSAWPEFMLQDPIGSKYWNDLYEAFPEFQVVIVDEQTCQVVAVANTAPVSWNEAPKSLPDRGWDWALEHSILGEKNNATPNLLCGLAVSIAPPHRGKGIGSVITLAMKTKAGQHGLNGLIVPVRPSLKSRYPLIDMGMYVRWRNHDDLPFDPWLRVHVRHGAEILNVCSESMRITGTIAQWESWTGMAFPESGAYVIPDALVPIVVDYNTSEAAYVEPNVWVIHRIK